MDSLKDATDTPGGQTQNLISIYVSFRVASKINLSLPPSSLTAFTLLGLL
jgi:hypothetical protein